MCVEKEALENAEGLAFRVKFRRKKATTTKWMGGTGLEHNMAQPVEQAASAAPPYHRAPETLSPMSYFHQLDSAALGLDFANTHLDSPAEIDEGLGEIEAVPVGVPLAVAVPTISVPSV